MWIRIVWLSFWLLVAQTATVQSETRALLVGVSQYDETIGLPALRGPRNDVRLLKEVLIARGVTQITVLADGVAGANNPTHAAILAAMADLARTSKAGDLAIITLSGHGTRQPDMNGDETDGLDEVFLPADVGRAEQGSRLYPNALVDDEIGAAVLAIRQTGADVWLVLDSCYSGSGLRAGAKGVASRWVDPAQLGVSGLTGSTEVAGFGDAGGNDAPGKVVAFYASRSSEKASEINLTPDAANDDGWFGLFTSRLAARLQVGGAMTYRQLFQAVMADMNDDLVPGGARMQTPGWEGGLIDATVLGGRETVGVQQYAVSDGQVLAGLVHGLGNGTLLALVGDATSPIGQALGYAQMTKTDATSAALRPVDVACRPDSIDMCAVRGVLPVAARFARVIARPVDLVLRLAPVRDLATGQVLAEGSAEVTAVQAAIEQVNRAGQVRVAIDAGHYDIDVAVADGRVWFGRRVSIGQTPVGVSWHPGASQPLAAILVRIAQAEHLATMLGAISGGGTRLSPNPVQIDAEVLSSRLADLDPPGQVGDVAKECGRAFRAVAGDDPTPLADASDLKQCDHLTFSARGKLRGGRDLNRIHIDSQFCVHAAYARIEDTIAATGLGPAMDMCSDCPDGFSAGDERLFVVVTQSKDNTEALNLEGLLDNCQGRLTTTRGAARQQAMDFLTTLGRRPDTRGSFAGLSLVNVWVTAYQWQVVPKAELFRP